jgi:hypothetical protein
MADVGIYTLITAHVTPSPVPIYNGLSLPERYCGRDRGMPKGRLFNWEGMATMGRQNPETRWVESCLFSICVTSLSLIDAQKTVPVPIRG